MADGALHGNVWCGRCKTFKPKSDFSRHSGMEDGRQKECRRCHSEQNKAHYAANKGYYVEKAAANRASRLEAALRFIEAALPGRCEKCGEEVSIDNHRRVPRGLTPIADKSIKVMALHGWSVKRIQTEIEASLIVCRPQCGQ